MTFACHGSIFFSIRIEVIIIINCFRVFAAVNHHHKVEPLLVVVRIVPQFNFSDIRAYPLGIGV